MIECSRDTCKSCESKEIIQIGLIDSEVYCQCRKCGRLKLACDKAKECNDKCNAILKGG